MNNGNLSRMTLKYTLHWNEICFPDQLRGLPKKIQPIPPKLSLAFAPFLFTQVEPP